jgi:hypothetical protein
MIPELLRMSVNVDQSEDGDYDGLLNTAWTRVAIDIEVRTVGSMVIHRLTSHRENRKASQWP